MALTIRLTYKGSDAETTFSLVAAPDGCFLLRASKDGADVVLPLVRRDGHFSIDGTLDFEESKDVIDERLAGLSEEYLASEADGIEPEADSVISVDDAAGYRVDDIYVENKPFSISQLLELIRQGDLELAPNFQRNFVWDRTRQSLLIESILLGLPLPSIYLSQYPDGILTIVDGLQRISTIKHFMEDGFALTNLEYLKVCNGLRYSELMQKLPPLRVRRFGQTQLMCFVIDYRSPDKLKYDLFRHLNIGGKPLNGQEIRNCLSREPLQKALMTMSRSQEFADATCGSVSDRRMQAQEMCFRFLYFRMLYLRDKSVCDYNGKMDDSLNSYVEYLNRMPDYDYAPEIEAFRKAMRLAKYLFGDKAFRKITSKTSYRPPVNKLLMQCVSVLLSVLDYDKTVADFAPGVCAKELQELADNIPDFYNALTYSTNSRWNIEMVMSELVKGLPVFSSLR